MAVKASATVTLYSVIDIQAVCRYYVLQSSTLDKPATPTAYPPGGNWSDAEPTYTSGSTSSLYTVEMTLYSNGTYDYSPVSLSTSYEAAKEAYNKAQSAMDTAGNCFTKAETTAKLSLLEDRISSTVTELDTMQETLDGKADQTTTQELATRLQQTATELVAVVSRTTSLEGGQAAADELLTQYRLTFRIDDSGVTIGKSNSDFDLHMDNTQLQFRQAGEVIAYISNNKLYIANAEVTSSLQIASYAWRRMEDGSLGLMYEG